MKTRVLMTFLSVLAAREGLRAAEEAAPPPAAIKINDLRHLDDAAAWRANPAEDCANTLKDIDLAEGVTLSLGGQLRLRFENWDNFAFAPANDDSFFLGRLRLHGDLKLGDRLRVFVEGRSADTTDRDLPGGKRAIDRDTLDLQNAFVDVILPVVGGVQLTLRPGRQEMNYGAQRLLSALDWVNTRRTFDGGRLLATAGGWKIDGIAARLVQVDPTGFNDEDSGRNLYGVYATKSLKDIPVKTLDLYWLVADNETNTFAAAAGDENRDTFGGRVTATCPLSGVDVDLEGAWQTGDVAGQDVEAHMVAVALSRKIPFCPLGSSITAGYDLASGDGDKTDGELNTFNQLYPLGHKYFGWADFVGRQNIRDLQAGWEVPAGKAKASVVYHWFDLDEKGDALYNAAGAIQRAGSDTASGDVGDELDLLVTLPVDNHLTVSAGWSKFFAGRFLSDTGAHEDVDFLYSTVQLTF
ncbi:MAG: alginate export family protein [Kiritimatiellia bacterium]